MPIIPLSDTRLQARSAVNVEAHNWQWHLQHAIRTICDLERALDITLLNVTTDFPLLVPQPYLGRIEKGQVDDPLLLQVLPRFQENQQVPGYNHDPVGELGLPAMPTGLMQKYQGRVLVTLPGACAVNCRYCFRRHYPYEDNQPNSQEIEMILDFLRRDHSIHEVILSGGDPLVMKDSRLIGLLDDIAAIDHIRTIRFHTRLPIVIPQRVTQALVDNLAKHQRTHTNIVIVFHTNHPNEIDDHVKQAVAWLKTAGVTLLNQSVLLKNVNDSSETLTRLSRSLFDAGILPYYLHALDPVAGAAHFDVTEERGHDLIREMTAQLPGYLIPRFVREVSGASSKQMLYPV